MNEKGGNTHKYMKAKKLRKALFYKDWKGNWVRDSHRPTKKRVAWVAKHKAENGRVTVQEVLE